MDRGYEGIIIVIVNCSIARLFVGGRVEGSHGDECMIIQFCSWGGHSGGVNENDVLLCSLSVFHRERSWLSSSHSAL